MACGDTLLWNASTGSAGDEEADWADGSEDGAALLIASLTAKRGCSLSDKKGRFRLAVYHTVAAFKQVLYDCDIRHDRYNRHLYGDDSIGRVQAYNIKHVLHSIYLCCRRVPAY